MYYSRYLSSFVEGGLASMGDYHILMQFDLDASRADLHRALSTQAGITSWWSRRAELTPERSLRV